MKERGKLGILSPKMDMNSDIPLVNFEPFLHGSATDREHVASTIDVALSSVGFIYLSNHGLDQRKVDECFRWVSDSSHNIFVASSSSVDISRKTQDC